MSDLGDRTQNAEIAFFGGSFTAIDLGYMISLLESVQPFIDKFCGIRLSTRPDYIDDDILVLLKKYNVTTSELGAQSMADEVLTFNQRGHSSDDVRKASELIKSYGFNLGLQMMTGLYKSDFDKDRYTANEFVKLRPDCVRIYPTVVMKNTELEKLYKSKVYIPYTLDESVELCSELMTLFYDNSIDVIRVGLHYSDSLKSGDVAGNYHPAFKELCENRIFLNNFLKQTEGLDSKDVIVTVNPSSVSKFTGQNRKNLIELENSGYRVKIEKDRSIPKYGLKVKDNR